MRVRGMRTGISIDVSTADRARLEAVADRNSPQKDRDALLTFYDFPAEHWGHLRTPNPIEGVFATVRHRTVRTKRAVAGDRQADGVPPDAWACWLGQAKPLYSLVTLWRRQGTWVGIRHCCVRYRDPGQGSGVLLQRTVGATIRTDPCNTPIEDVQHAN